MKKLKVVKTIYLDYHEKIDKSKKTEDTTVIRKGTLMDLCEMRDWLGDDECFGFVVYKNFDVWFAVNSLDEILNCDDMEFVNDAD